LAGNEGAGKPNELRKDVQGYLARESKKKQEAKDGLHASVPATKMGNQDDNKTKEIS